MRLIIHLRSLKVTAELLILLAGFILSMTKAFDFDIVVVKQLLA